MDQEWLLKYLKEWATELHCVDERDVAHRETVLELIKEIERLKTGQEVKQ